MTRAGDSGSTARRRAGVALSRSAILAAMLAVASPASAQTFRANYALSIVGLSIGNAYATASLAPSAYKIDIGLKLAGLASLVSNAKGAATGSGAIVNNAVLPAAYANTSANAQETRTIRMGLEAGNVRAVDIQPPFPEPELRVPVTDAMKRGILDPISALLMPVAEGQPFVGPTVCDRKLPVFDGLVRFDVTLSYSGTRNVTTRGFSGPVTICAARYVPIAGYRRDSSATKYMADNRNMEVWLAPFEKARVVVPYLVSIKTSTGTLLIQASELHFQ